jgi:hypothetical protein
VGKIVDFFPFASVTENELVSLYFGFAAAISDSSSSNASATQKVRWIRRSRYAS